MSLEDAGEWARKWGPLLAILGMILGLLINAIRTFGWSWTVAGYITIAIMSFILGYIIRYWQDRPSFQSKTEPKTRVEKSRTGTQSPTLPFTRMKRKGDASIQIKKENQVVTPEDSVHDARVCTPGPHRLKAGKSLEILLWANPGDTILGILEEIDRYEFDYHILSEEALDDFLAGDEFYSTDAGFDEYLYKIRFKIPAKPSGHWYLVLDAPGKQLDRDVQVRLRKARK